MKEKIYTIPINEAFEQNCECPLCFIERRLEKEAAEYTLGPAMMEPDHREESNKKGYCNKHFNMLFKAPNKLPLALVLDTHLEEIRKNVSVMKKVSGKGIFKRAADKPSLAKVIDSCMICEKVEKSMYRYCNVLLSMWAEDKEFKGKFDKSRGFCIPHFEKLYSMSSSVPFLTALAEKEEAELEVLQEDIHKFTLKFDYRNKDMEWGTAKDAPVRVVEKIAGYIESSEEKSEDKCN